ncbi:MAG TPA: DUF6600 domain-containing protein [Planctomycetota bacterium]|nr:DUF6600 domain-containing protein [Planctomycetota bacterium]
MTRGKAGLGAAALFLLLPGCVRHVVHHYPPPPREEPPPPPSPPPPPPDEDVADPTPFREPLRPYGAWRWEEPYGWIWVPRVAPGWRPYWDGRWVYTDAHGWYWNSDEPWGWAVYHYGRWYVDDRHGWAWVPGSVWGPAWVAWRGGGGFVGWAPLPPAVGFDPGVGASFARFDVSVGIPAPAWMFVPEPAILAPRIREEIVLSPRNVTIIQTTQHVTNITVVDNRVVNVGIPVQRVEKVTGRPVPRRRVREIGSADELGDRTESEETVRVFRPKVAKAKARARGPAEKVSRDGTAPGSPASENEEGKQDLEAGQAPGAETIEERHPREKGSPPSRGDSEELRRRQEKDLRQERERAERERKDEERRKAREERKGKGNEPAPPASKPAALEGELRESHEEPKGDREGGQPGSAETPGEPHSRGKAMPPPGVDPEKLRKRQQEEALRAEREKKLQERREAREERKGKGTASAPSERGGEKEPPASKPAQKKKD